MPGRKPPSEAVLARAAELRATGHNWEATAEKMKRSSHTISKWPLKYPDRWAAALRDAQRRAINDTASESLLILRQLARGGGDDKLRLAAAAYLAGLQIEQTKLDLKAKKGTPDIPPLAIQIARFMEAHTDEDIARMAEFLRQPTVPERVRECRVLSERSE